METPKRGQARDRALAERLRAMRQRWGETQLTFSRHFPVGRQTYCGWERFGVPPGPTALMVKMVLAKLGEILHQRRPGKNGKREAVSE
jgi:DNA-binding transcriptional regulator YiaG